MSVAEQFARIGIGNVGNVACALSNDPDIVNDIHINLHKAAQGLIPLSREGLESGLARKLACAILNLDFRTTGVLWSCSDDLTITQEYVDDNKARGIIATLVGL